MVSVHYMVCNVYATNAHGFEQQSCKIPISACTAFGLSIIWGIAVMTMGRVIIWISIILIVIGIGIVGGSC